MVAEVEAVVEVEVGEGVVTAPNWVSHQTRAIDRIKIQALLTGCLGELVLCLKSMIAPSLDSFLRASTSLISFMSVQFILVVPKSLFSFIKPGFPHLLFKVPRLVFIFLKQLSP